MLRLGKYSILKLLELLHLPKHLEKSKRNTNSSAPQETILWGEGEGGEEAGERNFLYIPVNLHPNVFVPEA